MQLKNQVEWALHCCGVLAAMPQGTALPTRVLAEFHGVPKEYLGKALQALSQAGIVTGTLGPSGGYQLARKPEDITFLDIVEAVGGGRSGFVCNEIRLNNPQLTTDEKRCTRARPCAIARVMWEADEAWRSTLRRVRLSDLLKTLSREVPADALQNSYDWILNQR